MKIPDALPTIYPVTCHTDHVGPGTTFVVIKGAREDGSKYIPLALEKGASKIVQVENGRLALAQLSAQAWGYPASKLKIIGVTGTKGKTTTSFILAHLLAQKYNVGLLSTVYNKINNKIYPTHLTTQHPDYLHMFLAQCVQAGVEYVVMEVAAQALTLSRVAGIEFHAALFTNFAQEHGEFYANLDEYFAAKCRLFDQVKEKKNIFVNRDDQWGQKILAGHEYSNFGTSDVQVTKNDQSGIAFGSYSCPSLLGTHNIYNALGAINLAQTCGMTPQEIQAALQTFPGVPGRLERYSLPNGSVAVIDYAHNPSSFQAILPLLRTLTPKLIVVFGCGGDREAGKRPIMGAIAAEIADLVILTTDNPRTENPAHIIQQIVAGVPKELAHKVHIELDREQAIKYAYTHAGNQAIIAPAIIALLGKGPEEYQVVGATKVPFSERAVLRSL